MISKVLQIFKKPYQTLNRIEILQNNLLHNYQYLSSLNRKLKIAPVLKSNAYGHGIIEVSKILAQVGAPFFCVDSLYEAYELVKAHIKTPILIMGYTDPQNFKVKKLPFSFAVFDLETAEILNDHQPGCGIHIFVDTGMHREGIHMKDLPDFLKKLKEFKNLKVEGLMSHLATAEKPNDLFTKKQINNFKYVQQIVSKAGFKPKWIHLSNSAGFLNSLSLGCNMARVGIALYGIDPEGKLPKLKPLLKFLTKIVQMKRLTKEDRVGYGGTFVIKKETLLGVLGAGYYDGVDRRLSNKGFVMVDRLNCPIIGRVSMNITTIDISRVSIPQIGEEVVVYSSNPKDANSIENCAKLCKTIPYDILVHLAASTKRIIV